MAKAMPVRKPRDFQKLSAGWNVVFNIIAAVFALACVFPFVFIVIISFTKESSLAENGYQIIPEHWSLEAYRYVFQNGDALLRSYGVTILVTVVGTVLALLVVTLYAYGISRKTFKYRNFFGFFAFFTMLFNGGLVPTYIVVTQMLGLKDSVWAMILPLMVNAFYILIMRTFFSTMVPDAIIESGKIDGAGEFQIFWKLVLPLALPGLATIALFSTLGYWNDWFNALLYIENPNLVPLQSMLMRIETNMQFLLTQASSNSSLASNLQNMPQDTSRMAMVVLATGPIILAYPFFQRYFVQGLTIGAVKE
ncbi:carbohydrate ABC transporter permease [Paenibacillus sp. D51F]|uniref:carbohydrate ABC transporter permease n=1 Tax=unclassified Paenibacillus TaxID=185978 RepID=UPI000956A012|nr:MULTISPECIES: carbohydrate ABC transporter permease [unclassified Paenibacillus]ASS68070.1 carbohydrate ABC transporter permease [Paenibacillus sp. RUD330]SIR39915.1 putative aldouronate transport system permease protein [Paenibacillus sp. RU4X]SIR50236.1 putative aldouronate transport system permease protein [Paenibacillus sp. RU4T]